MNTEITWRPENVEENVEMIKSGNSAERQTEDIEDEEEYDVHDKLLGNSKATAPPPAISKKKQRQLGPAPIASFEDISDEVRQKVCITPTTYTLFEFNSMTMLSWRVFVVEMRNFST